MNEKKIEEILKNIGSENMPADVQKIAEETSAQFSKTLMQSRQLTLWSIIMKSPITKLAAAAVIIIAAFFGANQFFGGTVTFAQVVQPILNARTVAFDFIVGDEKTGPVIHDIVVGSRIRRTTQDAKNIMIIDIDSAKMLTLDPETKGAAYVDIKGYLLEGTKGLLWLVRNIVADLKEAPVLELGKRQIDGRTAIGFFVKQHRPHLELTIWADQETASPVRIEMLMGQSFYILKNIEFDVPVDESLVSMDVPDGYTLLEAELDMSGFSEEDFIEILRLWAELLLDGKFPEKMSVEYIINQTSMIGEKINQLDITDEQKIKLHMAAARGFLFFQHLDPTHTDWHYAGKAVKLGDAETAVFWYQPEGSETYRVIYGDLSVEDVAPENLPK